MAGIKAPIQDILTRLETLQVANGDGSTGNLPARIWNNQVRYENDGKLADFPKPAAFVEVINNPVFEQIGIGFRSSDIGFNIHLVAEEFDSEQGTMEQNLTVFDLRDRIIALLSNWRPTACSVMTSTTEQQDFEHTNIYHYIISFVCNFIDSKGSQYDTGAGVYVDSNAPTELELTVVLDKTPGADQIFTSSRPFNIPK